MWKPGRYAAAVCADDARAAVAAQIATAIPRPILGAFMGLLLSPGLARRGGEGFGEIHCRLIPVNGLSAHCLVEDDVHLAGKLEVGSRLVERRGILLEPRDHERLRCPALERQLAREHLVRHEAERVDVGTAVELLAAKLFRAHELRR